MDTLDAGTSVRSVHSVGAQMMALVSQSSPPVDPPSQLTDSRADTPGDLDAIAPSVSPAKLDQDGAPSVASNAVPASTPPNHPATAPHSRQGLAQADGSSVPIQLERAIARGGMGEVWRGQQTSLQREVAVKVPMVGDPREFLREAKTSGALDHPNIVPVYDLVQGQSPMLVMKLVRGEPWFDAIEEDRDAQRRLNDDGLARHLRILESVCEAVAYAHHRGVLHRDLKPGQVMLGDFGETYLMDWGLASALDGRPLHGDDEPLDWRCGTPCFMSPEQASEKFIGLSPSTDVYLLGGILYDLLTGYPPHHAINAHRSLQRALTNEIPPIASDLPAELAELAMQCLSTSPGDRPATPLILRDALRDFQTGATRRNESLSLSERAEEAWSDLQNEAVQLDALSVHARESAISELVNQALQRWPLNPAAGDVRASLLAWQTQRATERGELVMASLRLADYRGAIGEAHRPTAAQPDPKSLSTAIDVAQRKARARDAQRRLALVVSVLLLVALGAGSMWWARSERRRALIERDLRTQAERNLAAALAHGEGATNLIDFVLGELKDALDAELTPERGITKDNANEIAHNIAGRVATPITAYYRELNDKPLTDDLRINLARYMNAVSIQLLRMHRHVESMELTSMTLEIDRELLGEEHVQTSAASLHLSAIYAEHGRFAEALELGRRVLEVERSRRPPDEDRVATAMEGVAQYLSKLGMYDEAKPMLKELLATYRAMGSEGELDAADVLYELALLAEAEGDLEAAQLMYEELLSRREALHGPVHRNVATALGGLGVLMSMRGKAAEAIPLLERAVVISEKEYGPHHSETGKAYTNLGFLHYQLGNTKAAGPYFLKALENMEKNLGPDHPDVADCLTNVTAISVASGDFRTAIAQTQRCLAIYEKTFGLEHARTADCVSNLAYLMQAAGDVNESLPLHERAIEIREKTIGVHHAMTALSYNNYGQALVDLGQFDRARIYLQKSLEIRQEVLGEEHPDVAESLQNVGSVFFRQGDAAQAATYIERAVAIQQAALGDDHPRLGAARLNLASIHKELGDLDSAEKEAGLALEIATTNFGPDHPQAALCYTMIGHLHKERSEYDKALEFVQKAKAINIKVLGSNHPAVADSLQDEGILLCLVGRREEGLDAMESSYRLLRERLGEFHRRTIANLVSKTMERVSGMEPPAGEAELTALVDRLESAVAANPIPKVREGLADTFAARARLRDKQGKREEAISDAKRAIDVYREAETKRSSFMAAAEAMIAGGTDESATIQSTPTP